MNRYIIKQFIKFGILFVVLVYATIFVYDAGKNAYQKYLDSHSDDITWIKDNVNLVEDNKIGSGVLRPDVLKDLEVTEELYLEIIEEEINKLLINNYKINNPLLIYNPYNIDKSTVNIYFHTGENYKFEYHVTTETILLEEDITYTRITTETGLDKFTNRHFYVLDGFVPGKRNNLLIRILDENDQVIDAENFILNLPSK